MNKIYDILEYNKKLTTKDNYTMITNSMTDICNRYLNLNSRRPNMYISNDIQTINYIIDRQDFYYNTQYYISELIGTLNGYNVYTDEFIEKGKFCVCTESEFNILKRGNKIYNILKRIKNG